MKRASRVSLVIAAVSLRSVVAKRSPQETSNAEWVCEHTRSARCSRKKRGLAQQTKPLQKSCSASCHRAFSSSGSEKESTVTPSFMENMRLTSSVPCQRSMPCRPSHQRHNSRSGTDRTGSRSALPDLPCHSRKERSPLLLH